MDIDKKRILYRKELKTELRSLSSIIAFTMCNIVLIICVVYYYNNIFMAANVGYSTHYKLVLDMYNTVILIEYILIMCFVPFTAGRTFGKEYETNTIDIMLLTSLTTKDILHAKIKQMLVVYLVLIISTLPALTVVFSVGVVGIIDILLYVLVTMSSVVLFGIIGMYISAVSKKVVFSALITCAIETVILFGTYFILIFGHNIIDGFAKNKDVMYEITKIPLIGNIMLLNPLFCVFKVQNYTQGNNSTYKSFINKLGVWDVVDRYWIILAVGIQLFVAYYFYKRLYRLLVKRHIK